MFHVTVVVGSEFTYHEHALTNGSLVTGQLESGESIDGIERETPGIAFTRRSVKHAQVLFCTVSFCSMMLTILSQMTRVLRCLATVAKSDRSEPGMVQWPTPATDEVETRIHG